MSQCSLLSVGGLTRGTPRLRPGPGQCSVDETALDARGTTEVTIQGVTQPLTVVVIGGIHHPNILGAHICNGWWGAGVLYFCRMRVRWFGADWPMVIPSGTDQIDSLTGGPWELTGYGFGVPEVSSERF